MKAGFRSFTPRHPDVAELSRIRRDRRVCTTCCPTWSKLDLEANRDRRRTRTDPHPAVLPRVGRAAHGDAAGARPARAHRHRRTRVRFAISASAARLRRPARSDDLARRRLRHSVPNADAVRVDLRAARSAPRREPVGRELRTHSRARLDQLRTLNVKTVLLLALALAAAQESSKGGARQLRRRARRRSGGARVQRAAALGQFPRRERRAFSYPFLGRVRPAAGRSAPIAALLKERLAEGYLRNPQVTVDVEQFRSQSVFVMGEVRTPGKYILSGSVTLLDALAQAGSPTPAAGGEVLILHPKSQIGRRADAAQPARRRGHARQPARDRGRQAVAQRDDPRRRHDLRAESRALLRHRDGSQPGLVRPRAQHDGAAGDFDGRRHQRARIEPPPQDRAHRGQQAEGTRRQADRHRDRRETRSSCGSGCCEHRLPVADRPDRRRRSGASRAARRPSRVPPLLVASSHRGVGRTTRRTCGGPGCAGAGRCRFPPSLARLGDWGVGRGLVAAARIPGALRGNVRCPRSAICAGSDGCCGRGGRT